MLRFLSPIWLAGLAALAIPLLLHLWNRRPTAVVRIGSLRGLTGPHGPRAFGRRPDDIPLLLLRMALVTAVVVGLAGLAVRGARTSGGSAEVFLVDPDLLKDSLALFSDPVVDSVRRSGIPIHLLSRGFPALGGGAGPGRAAGPWTLLRQLDDSLPPGSRVTILSRQRAGQFSAVRPGLASHYTFRVPDPEPQLDLLADRPVDLASVEIIVGEGYERDGQVALAAWAAAAEAHAGAPPRTMLRSVNEADGASKATVIVWLADQSVSQSILDRVVEGAILVQYALGEPIESRYPHLTSANSSAASEMVFRESVWLRTQAPEGTPVLIDESGAPLLTVASLGSGRHYRFASRFSEEWSSLAMGADLPEIALLTLRGLLTGVDAAPVWPSQAAPRFAESIGPTGSSWRALTNWGVFLATMLLVAERLISHRRHRIRAA